MFKKLMAAGLAAALMATPQGAWAWGGSGHRLIGQAAIRGLPEEMPAFLRTTDSATLVGELSREPDRWKGAGQIHGNDRDNAHFIDLDDQGRAMGGPALDALPPTLEAYRTAVRAAGSTENAAGWLPYALIDAWQQVRHDFAYWRVLAAAEARATDPGRRAWYAQDRRMREFLILRDIGVLSHYVGDGSQPHHTTIHYNGWGNFPNPRNFTNERNFHSQFESAYTGACARLPAVQAAMRAPVLTDQPVERRTPAYLRRAWEQVVPLYELEQQGAFRTQTPQGCGFITTALGSAASELRDLLILAWRGAESREVGWRPVRVSEVEAGRVEPFDSLYGTD